MAKKNKTAEEAEKAPEALGSEAIDALAEENQKSVEERLAELEAELAEANANLAEANAALEEQAEDDEWDYDKDPFEVTSQMRRGHPVPRKLDPGKKRGEMGELQKAAYKKSRTIDVKGTERTFEVVRQDH